MRSLTAVLLVILAALATGCSETVRSVIERERPAMNVLRADLLALAPKLPAPGAQLPPKPTSFDPKPESRIVPDSSFRSGNVEFIAEEQLNDPDAQIEFDFYLSHDLLSCLRWTGPKNPMSDINGRAAPDFAAAFERARATKYLVVIRTSELRKAVVAGETFTGGGAAIEAFLVDLPAKAVRAGVRVVGRPQESVSYSFKGEVEKEERARSAVMSTVWSDARKKLLHALAEATGGTFDID